YRNSWLGGLATHLSKTTDSGVREPRLVNRWPQERLCSHRIRGPASGYPPDGKCSCLNCRFNGAQSGLSARAGRDEQNVVAPKCDIRFLSPENILKIHGHLFALSVIGLEPPALR